MTLVLALVAALSGRVEAREPIPQSIPQAIQMAQKELDDGKHPGRGAVVFTVNTPSTPQSSGKNQNLLQFRLNTLGGGGYYPGQMQEGEIVTRYFRKDWQFDLRIWGVGFHQSVERGVVREGRVLVFNNISLEPVRPTTACTLKGNVVLEGRTKTGPVSVWIRGFPYFKSAPDGTFAIHDLGEGQYQVHASESGYLTGWAYVTLERGKTSTVQLNLEQERYAVLKWGSQPNGTRDLQYGLKTGLAAVSAREARSFTITDGFDAPSGKADIAVRQENGIPTFWCSHQGKNGPGILKLDGVSFADIKVAPNTAYDCDWQPIEVGSTYIVQSYDGTHFAKIEVLLVTTDRTERDRLLVSGTGNGNSPKPAGSSSPANPPATPQQSGSHAKPGTTPPDGQSTTKGKVPVSVAVLDFDTRGPIDEGIAMAVSDMCRNVMQQEGRFIMVDRTSMVDILGEQDLMSTLKCDNTRCLVNYGKKLRAQKIVKGRLSKAGKSIVMSVKIIDVASATIDAQITERARNGVDELLDRMEAITERLIDTAVKRRRPGF